MCKFLRLRVPSFTFKWLISELAVSRQWTLMFQKSTSSDWLVCRLTDWLVGWPTKITIWNSIYHILCIYNRFLSSMLLGSRSLTSFSKIFLYKKNQENPINLTIDHSRPLPNAQPQRCQLMTVSIPGSLSRVARNQGLRKDLQVLICYYLELIDLKLSLISFSAFNYYYEQNINKLDGTLIIIFYLNICPRQDSNL